MASEHAEEHLAGPALRAEWLTMSLVHWPLPIDTIQAMLPVGLTVDGYEGSAWISLTPFRMTPQARARGVDVRGRMTWLEGISRGLGLPRFATALETNLRTYVRGPDGRDGLWFLGLDADNPCLVLGSRAAVGAPYHFSRMGLDLGEEV